MIIDARQYITNPVGNHPMRQIVGVALHHEGPPANRSPNLTQTEELQIIVNIDVYHRDVKGWGGFAYHGAAFPSGRAYKTGALTGTRAHVRFHNSTVLGIAYMDDLSNRVATSEGIDAMAEIALDFWRELGAEPPLAPHREWGGTGCPMQLQILKITRTMGEMQMLTQNQFLQKYDVAPPLGQGVARFGQRLGEAAVDKAGSDLTLEELRSLVFFGKIAEHRIASGDHA